MPNLTDSDVHEIALMICSAREQLRKIDGCEDIERALFEAECALGRSLPPVTGTIVLHG